jgi:spermidine synthase
MKGATTYSWFREPFGDFCASLYAVEGSILRLKTRYQEVEIVQTPAFGKMLIVDGRVQVSELDEFIYHEALVHPGMLHTVKLESALIVGGGPGATLREMLRYRSLRRVVMVDIDEKLVDACRSHLPALNAGAFTDPRLEIRFQDAQAYLEHSQEQFDAIIVDLTAPRDQGASQHLWTREFYALASKRLTDAGVLTTHGGPLCHGEMNWPVSVARDLKTQFPFVKVLQAHIPCFGWANPWSFMLASRQQLPETLTKERVDALIRERLGQLRYLDGDTYIHAATLPKHLRSCFLMSLRLHTFPILDCGTRP